MAAAPGLIEAAHVPCTLSEARFMFRATGADKSKAKVYEVACQEGLGYVIVTLRRKPTPRPSSSIAWQRRSRWAASPA